MRVVDPIFVIKVASMLFEYKFDSAIGWPSFAISSVVAEFEFFADTLCFC